MVMLGRIAAITVGALLVLAIVVCVGMAASSRKPEAVPIADFQQTQALQKIMDAVNLLTNDVQALQVRQSDNDKVLARSSGVEIKNAAAIVEIESQFCMNDLVRNATQQYNMMLMKMTWEKAFPGSTFPTDNQFYPHICNEVAAAARAAAPDAPPK